MERPFPIFPPGLFMPLRCPLVPRRTGTEVNGLKTIALRWEGGLVRGRKGQSPKPCGGLAGTVNHTHSGAMETGREGRRLRPQNLS